MCKKKIAIYGASGHGKVVAETAELNGFEIVCFVDDDESKSHFCGLPVVRFDDLSDKNLDFALGIGANKTREKIFQKLTAENAKMPALIHPKSIVSSKCEIGSGTVVMAGVVVNAYAKIGQGVILNSSCVIEHDCEIFDFVHISPKVAIAGAVTVKERTHLGIGSSVIQCISIGRDCIIGAGASVISDIGESSLAVGVPARVIKRLD